MKNKIYRLVQFHTDTMSPSGNDLVSQYYQSIYEHPYYHKPSFAWELPLWAAELSFSLDKIKHDFKVLNEPVKLTADYVFGSVMNVNKKMFLELAMLNPNTTFMLGGYIESGFFFDCDNVVYVASIKESMKYLGLRYNKGVSWELFRGEQCIPRITMSEGCAHKCKFCTIPNAITQRYTWDIVTQAQALKPLRFNLVYLDDKTFGQSSNYRFLRDLYPIIKEFNPEFVGFVVQTTASAAVRINWQNLHVYAAEIGVESYNDDILKGLNKPTDTKTIDRAESVLKDLGIKYIPNIVIGFVDETIETYKITIKHLRQTDFLHVNLYNLAIYDDAELSRGVDSSSDGDSNELVSEKSYNTYYQNRLNNTVIKSIAKLLLNK